MTTLTFVKSKSFRLMLEDVIYYYKADRLSILHKFYLTKKYKIHCNSIGCEENHQLKTANFSIKN